MYSRGSNCKTKITLFQSLWAVPMKIYSFAESSPSQKTVKLTFCLWSFLRIPPLGWCRPLNGVKTWLSLAETTHSPTLSSLTNDRIHICSWDTLPENWRVRCIISLRSLAFCFSYLSCNHRGMSSHLRWTTTNCQPVPLLISTVNQSGSWFSRKLSCIFRCYYEVLQIPKRYRWYQTLMIFVDVPSPVSSAVVLDVVN